MNFADPRNDVAFKKIFGDENKKEILISFLNNILGFAGTEREIIELTIENPYQAPKLEGLKTTILDIKVLDKRGIHYIIEMQVLHTEAFEKKVLYYVSKAYAQQMETGENYPTLNPVIFLGFLNFKLFKENENYASRHLILDEKTNQHLFTDFELHFIELPKFKKSLEELTDVKDKWIYFVKHAGDMSVIPGEMSEPKEIREAFEAANKFTWSKEDLDAYDAKGIYIADERQRIVYAEKMGIEKGEKQKALAIAKAMLAENMPIDTISKITGLTQAEIQE